jgi:Glycosyl hydrolases family 18
MKRRTPILLAAATATVTLISITSAGAAHATPAFGPSLPQYLYAPYYETYDSSTDMATLSQQSGAHYLSLAFLETATPGSCTADWDGDPTLPIASSTYGADIAAIQAHGGNVIPSFGGYTADTTGTELADSCSSVDSIAQVYESLITTYNVPRIDLDIEGTSVTNTAGINRRNEAIAETEAWAAAHGRSIQFSYTLPTFPTGLPAAELGVLQNAVADGAVISTVNLETFDYYIGTQQNMLTDTISAATALEGQLQTLYPADSSRQLWHMVGITEMPGIDDFGPDETFTQADAVATAAWARIKGVGMLSMWALQRDNGGCPGTKGAGTCSGVTQPNWFFSHVFELYGI